MNNQVSLSENPIALVLKSFIVVKVYISKKNVRVNAFELKSLRLMGKNHNFDGLELFHIKRIFLVKHALYKAYTETSKDKVSLYRIIDIFLLLYQSPIALAVYRKKSIGNRVGYINIFNSISDPRVKKSFDESIFQHSYFKDNGDVKNSFLTKDSEVKYLHPFLGEKYGMLIFHIKREKKDRKKIVFSVIPKKDSDGERIESKLFNYFWDVFSSSEYAEKLDLTQHLINILDGINNNKKENKLSIPEGLYKEEMDDCFYERIVEKIESVVDETYKEVYKSSLVSINKKFPPNVFFHYKNYRNDGIVRHGNYKYDTFQVLGDSQKKHIKKMFEIIKSYKARNNSNTDNKNWYYPLTFFNEKWEHDPTLSLPEKNEYFYSKNKLTQKINESFWEILSEDDGIDKILDSISAKLPSDSYSLADPVLSGSTMYVRKNPFSYGGSERSLKFDSNSIDIKDPKNKDILKKVSGYYLVSAVAPESTNETLRMFFFPVRINGATLFCVSSTTTAIDANKTRELSDREREQIEDASWDFGYHFASDILPQVVRKIRRSLEKKYIEILTEIIHSALYECTKNTIVNLVKFKRNVNQKTIWLARMLPYKIIYFLDKEEDLLEKTGSKVYIKGNPDTMINFTLIENNFFENIIDYDFFSLERVSKILEEAIKNAVYQYSLEKSEGG